MKALLQPLGSINRKALEKFKCHSLLIGHCKAVMKCHQLQKAPIDNTGTFNLQTQRVQANALLTGS